MNHNSNSIPDFERFELCTGNDLTSQKQLNCLTQPNSSLDYIHFIDKKGNITISYFDYLLNSIPRSKEIKLVFSINNHSDMYKAFQRINDELPSKVNFISKNIPQRTIKHWYYEFMDTYLELEKYNLLTLANYKVSMFRNRFHLIDCSHSENNARDIRNTVVLFISALAECIKHQNKEQIIFNLYQFIFENIDYNASTHQKMRIGNLGRGEMACNGISRLVYETLNRLGIKTEIRRGLSHFWNVIYLKGKEITFDVTTDILLNNKYLTLGNSSIQHIQNASTINFYNVNFDTLIYREINEYKFERTQRNTASSIN